MFFFSSSSFIMFILSFFSLHNPSIWLTCFFGHIFVHDPLSRCQANLVPTLQPYQLYHLILYPFVFPLPSSSIKFFNVLKSLLIAHGFFILLVTFPYFICLLNQFKQVLKVENSFGLLFGCLSFTYFLSNLFFFLSHGNILILIQCTRPITLLQYSNALQLL